MIKSSKPPAPSAASTRVEGSTALPETSDEGLLAAWVEGDEAAFECLIERFGHRLFAFVRRTMGDPERAADVYQEVLVKIATKAHLYQHRSNLTAWLFQVARNTSLDHLRRESRRPTVSLGDGDDDGRDPLAQVPGREGLPDADATRVELGIALRQAIDALPDEQREVFLLREEGELTFDEIGSLLSCGKETAKSRMRYALERLRNALGREARSYGLQ